MNVGIMIVIAIAGLWALGMFLGVIGGLTKPNTHSPQAIDSSAVQAQEQKTIQETEDQRQKLMDDMKQKMDFAGQKY